MTEKIERFYNTILGNKFFLEQVQSNIYLVCREQVLATQNQP